MKITLYMVCWVGALEQCSLPRKDSEGYGEALVGMQTFKFQFARC